MSLPLRPAWVEIDLGRLRANFAAIQSQCPAGVWTSAIVKDDAYGHGAVRVAQTAIEAGVKMLVVSTLAEAIELRESGLHAPILLLGERPLEEISYCVSFDITCCVSEKRTVEALATAGRQQGKVGRYHVKIDTGMSRYGIAWSEAPKKLVEWATVQGVLLEGILTHFAMSDEEDKSFARTQMSRFWQVVEAAASAGVQIPIKHLCNSGGFLDLPEAHGQLVRLGILPLGVYPSKVCRRIPGLLPVMSVKAKVAKIRTLEAGDVVGYGMRYQAPSRRRIAVLPIGYGDGFPRVRNEGAVLIRGQRARVIGGVSMDAITVDITDIPLVEQWDTAVIVGEQEGRQITIEEVAALKKSVTYDVLTSWRHRLPRVYS